LDQTSAHQRRTPLSLMLSTTKAQSASTISACTLLQRSISVPEALDI
jgi:hypothetical protein